MRPVVLLLAFAFGLCAAGPVLIVNARIFDGARMLPPTSVLLAEGRIRAIGGDLAAPANAQRYDARGQWLIPGLIDAHTHVRSREDLERALAFGVTTELDMFTVASLAADLRAEQAAGHAGGRADVRSSGTLVTAPGGHGTEYGVPIPTLSRPRDAQAFIDARIAEGSDYIKIIRDDGSAFHIQRPTLDRATLAAAIAAAHARGKLAIVHIATLADARDAIECGADGIAHVYAGGPDAGIARLAAGRHVFWTPTLEVTAADPQSRATALASVRGLHDAGVPILAGTDTPNPPSMHGSSLHDELALLVAAGLTPAEALTAATAGPAAAYKLEDRGRIAPGKRADLVLLTADPLRDIAATTKIAAIWKEGAAFTPRSVQSPAAVPAPAGARPDFTGTWKLDGVLLTIRHSEPGFQYSAEGRRGALAVHEGFEFTTDGKPPADPAKLSVVGQWEGDALSMRYVKDGRELMKFTYRLTPDGRQLIRESARPDGQQIREVWERQ